MTGPLASLLVLLAAGDGWLDVPVPARPPATEATVEAGRRLYARRCAFCHGEAGDGQGPVARYLDPRPRDFSSGQFKFRTTVSGELPTDEDLFRTITRGVPGTAMPAWAPLAAAERWGLVDYLKGFYPDFADPDFDPRRVEEDGERYLLEIGEGPAASEALVAQGREVYARAKCFECHGETGRGDGPAAGSHRDDLGNRIWPQDLTRPWRYKGGDSAREVFRTFTTGLSGTPMPSYTGALEPGDAQADERARWALAHYVRSLQRPARSGTVLRVPQAQGALPEGPDDPAWGEAGELDVPLFGQAIRRPRWQTPSVDLVRVAALHDGERIAFRLEWSDRRANREHDPQAEPDGTTEGTYPVLDLSAFPSARLADAVALQFPARAPRGVERPYLLYGQPGRPANLWRWRADGDRVEELVAEGPERIAVQPQGEQDLYGRGVHGEGLWRVVLVRALATGQRRDAALSPGSVVPFTVMAWDGGNGEGGIRQSLSSWYHLEVVAPVPVRTWLKALGLAMALALFDLYLLRAARRSGS